MCVKNVDKIKEKNTQTNVKHVVKNLKQLIKILNIVHQNANHNQLKIK